MARADCLFFDMNDDSNELNVARHVPAALW
jgi:hypothetical protein